MPAARTFAELQFWPRARAWSRDIFQLAQRAPFARDQRLVVQTSDSSGLAMGAGELFGGFFGRDQAFAIAE